MAEFLGVRFEGGADLAAVLRALPDDVRPDLMLEGLTQAAEPMRQRMGQLAPRGPDAPHLADSMSISRLREFDGVRVAETEVAVAVGPAKEFFYGFFWEFGWIRHPTPHPFMRPAYDEFRDRAFEVIGQEFWNAVARSRSTRSTSGGGL
jgi:HK97 gp10 family phage protein